MEVCDLLGSSVLRFLVTWKTLSVTAPAGQ